MGRERERGRERGGERLGGGGGRERDDKKGRINPKVAALSVVPTTMAEL